MVPGVMNLRLHVVALVALVCVLCQRGQGKDLFAPLRLTIDNFAALSSVGVYIANSTHDPIFSHMKDDWNNNDIIPLASGTKLVFAAMIMKIVEEGSLSLSDSPSRYIDFWTSEPLDLRSRITLKDLLAFTSGLWYDDSMEIRRDPSCRFNRNITLEQCALQIYREMSPLGGERRVNPGETFVYGGTHSHIAALMALKATGETSLNRLLVRYFNTPLGLPNWQSFFFGEPNPNADGGMMMSTSAYLRFLRSYYSGTYISCESVRLMAQDHTPSASTEIVFSPYQALFREFHYGFGQFIDCPPGVFRWDEERCSNYGMISSQGRFGFYPFLSLRYGYYGVIATVDLENTLVVLHTRMLGDLLHPEFVKLASLQEVKDWRSCGIATNSKANRTKMRR